MNANSNDNGWWCKPQMNIENQSAFWDAQSDVYEVADMTNDNQQEMDVVIGKCRELPYEDMVTLGGAVGCRDPKLILNDLLTRECAARPTLFFNDLSPKQVQRAREVVLKPCNLSRESLLSKSKSTWVENTQVLFFICPYRLLLLRHPAKFLLPN